MEIEWEKTVEDAVRELTQALNPNRIYLFGSCARGEQRSSSDLDLLVVVPDDSENKLLKTQKAYRVTRGLNVPKDIIVDHESVFRKRSNWISSIESEAVKTGKLIYARP